MNWHWLLEILEEAMPREDIVLANPFKTRIIAEAQIKTDKVDARILADLLRANLIAKVHICGKATRGAGARGQSYNIHPDTPKAVDGYPRDRCEAEFGVCRSDWQTKTIDFLLASLRELSRACRATRAGMCKL